MGERLPGRPPTGHVEPMVAVVSEHLAQAHQRPDVQRRNDDGPSLRHRAVDVLEAFDPRVSHEPRPPRELALDGVLLQEAAGQAPDLGPPVGLQQQPGTFDRVVAPAREELELERSAQLRQAYREPRREQPVEGPARVEPRGDPGRGRDEQVALRPVGLGERFLQIGRRRALHRRSLRRGPRKIGTTAFAGTVARCASPLSSRSASSAWARFSASPRAVVAARPAPSPMRRALRRRRARCARRRAGVSRAGERPLRPAPARAGPPPPRRGWSRPAAGPSRLPTSGTSPCPGRRRAGCEPSDSRPLGAAPARLPGRRQLPLEPRPAAHAVRRVGRRRPGAAHERLLVAGGADAAGGRARPVRPRLPLRRSRRAAAERAAARHPRCC